MGQWRESRAERGTLRFGGVLAWGQLEAWGAVASGHLAQDNRPGNVSTSLASTVLRTSLGAGLASGYKAA